MWSGLSLSLFELQSDFIADLTFPASGRILSHLSPHPKLSPSQQFHIYQDSFIGRLQKILSSTFPVCQKLVGDDFFFNMTIPYIETHAPTNDLNRYGATFSDFISQHPVAPQLPYLADVAKLEWAWQETFTAKDNPLFNFDELAAAYHDGLRDIFFKLPERSSLLNSPYPLQHIWETNQDAYQGDTLITLDSPQLFYFLIWRQQLNRKMDVLTYSEWQVLTLIKQQLSLNQICETIDTYFPHISLSQTLSKLVAQSWIYLS